MSSVTPHKDGIPADVREVVLEALLADGRDVGTPAVCPACHGGHIVISRLNGRDVDWCDACGRAQLRRQQQPEEVTA